MRRGFLAVLLVAAGMQISACATDPTPTQTDPGPKTTVFELADVTNSDTVYAIDVPDPLEHVNRGIYKFNALFDRVIFLPAIELYDLLLPTFIQERVTDFFSNLTELNSFANAILQGKIERASRAAVRFAVNSSVGLAGFFDPMTALGTSQQREDLGQTLGVWGAGEGPYLVLPLLGPSNLRDTAGRLGDLLAYRIVDPFGLSGFESDYPAISVLRIVDQRLNVPFRYNETGSPFEYELVRLFYTEKRRLDIAK